MSQELIVTIGSSLILMIGYFLRNLHTDLKKLQSDNSSSQVELQLLKLKQEQDRMHMEEMTQTKLQSLTDNVSQLTDQMKQQNIQIEQLVRVLVKNGFSPD